MTPKDWNRTGKHWSPKSSVDKWIAGGRAAAVESGAFGLSLNLKGPHTERMEFGGVGWVSARGGNVLDVTSQDKPLLTIGIDLELAAC